MYEKNGFKNIDIILMDKEMPVMTGATATEKLVNMGCRTPIVALTSCPNSLDEFVLRGAMGVLNKPLQIPNLLQTLLRTRSMKVEAEREAAEAAAAAAAANSQPAQTSGAFDDSDEKIADSAQALLWGMAKQLPKASRAPTMVTINPNVESWSSEDVCRWLSSLGHAYVMYATAFRYHGINGKALLGMGSPENFKMLGVIEDLHQKRIQSGILKLNEHMTKFRVDTKEEPLTKESEPEPLDLSDDDFVEKLCNRCTGDQFSDILVKIVSKSLPRLTEDAKQKIQILLNAPVADT